jgi:antitoxin component YwqK of YwqJK toxin-antitoxin module
MQRITIILIILFQCKLINCQITLNENTAGGKFLLTSESIETNMIVDGLKEGYWLKQRFLNKNITKSVTVYNSGKKDGEYYKFYRNGELKVEGYYKNNKKDGSWVFWRKNVRNKRCPIIKTENERSIKTYKNGKIILKMRDNERLFAPC